MYIGGEIMRIRLTNSNDEENIAMLIAQFRVELNQLKGIRSTLNLELGKEEFREFTESKYPIFIAEDDDKKLIGYIVCRIDNGTVWTESLFVCHEARRKGIASLLYKKAEEVATELGGDTVYNYVHPNNDKVILFLAKMGYDVLNLIEIRKPWENEVLTEKIKIGNYEYKY